MTRKREEALELALERLITGALQVVNNPNHAPFNANLSAFARMAQEVLDDKEESMTIKESGD